MAQKSEKGQTLVVLALVFVFVILPLAALAIDLPSLWWSRRTMQKQADAACLAGAIADQNGESVSAAVLANLAVNGADPAFYTPNEGSGNGLTKGIEIAGRTIRVALQGPTLAWFSQFIPGWTGWVTGAGAPCEKGLGGFLPLALKEWEGPDSRILETSDPNDEWSGACPDQSIDPESDVTTRNPPYCWVWGDLQILAGDGHQPNEGDVSMNGLIAPDVRCENPPSPDNRCTQKVYIPPAPEGSALNPLKGLTMDYIAAGGYDGPLPYVGVYQGVHSALIAQMEGVSNNFLVQEIDNRYNVGDLITGLIEVPGFDPEEGGEGELAVITADRERFVETHPKYIVYAEYMTTVLSKICRDLEKEYDDRREAEKRAKVDDAIKQVGEDLSAFDKLRNPPVGAGAQVTGARSENGDLYSRPTVSVVGREPQGRSGPKRRIPPDTWESIQATLESGRLRFGNVPYVIKQQNLGEEFEECEVRREQHLILVNTDHPSYEMAVREKCVEIVVFRAVAGKLAAEESRSAAEMCERLDEMVRFHASRVKTRIERAEAVD